jgi:glycosyltransferase involved in cell wall biosynthesis
MKILFVQIENLGGIHLYTANLANALSETQEIHFLLGKRLMNENYYSRNIKFQYVSSPRSYFKMFLLSMNPFTYFKLIKTIKSVDPDVIHVATPFLWIALVLPFLKKYPIVITEHDPAPHSGTTILVKLYVDFSKWIIRKSADAIIVHGNKMKQIVAEAGVEENKIWIMPHGEFSFYRKWSSDKIKERKVVLYFGTIREYKGIQYLLKAAPIVHSLCPDCKIVIAGSGNLNKYLPANEVPDYFEVYNRFIPDEEVAGLFQQAAVVVLPYIDGTQSGVVPLAYSFGKPVVVTNVGSIPESVDHGKTGYIVPPRNAEAIAEAVANLLNHDELRKIMGKNAITKLEKELSWSRIAEETIAIYKHVVMTHKT